MKYSFTLFLLFIGVLSFSFSQEKRELEIRIKKEAFPKTSLSLLSPYLEDAKRLRYYKEFDGEKTSFEAKFKKDRLYYSVEFDTKGVLEDLEFIITKQDIPEESWLAIQRHISENFTKPRIKKIQQQYPYKQGNREQLLKEAFQNLILPYINYEVVIACKEKKAYQQYELLYDSGGNFIQKRKLIPSRYDHILYN